MPLLSFLTGNGSFGKKGNRITRLSLDLERAQGEICELKSKVVDYEQTLEVANKTNALLKEQERTSSQQDQNKFKELEEARHQIIELIKEVNAARHGEIIAVNRITELEEKLTSIENAARGAVAELSNRNQALESMLAASQTEYQQTVSKLEARLQASEKARLSLEQKFRQMTKMPSSKPAIFSRQQVISDKPTASSCPLLKRTANSSIEFGQSQGAIAANRTKKVQFNDQITVVAEQENDPIELSLFKAAKIGDTAAIRSLIEAGANLEARDNYHGKTAFLLAVENSHLDAARLLSRSRTLPEIGDKDGFTPLMRASQRGDLAIVRFLLVNCRVENVDTKTRHQGETALFLASQAGHLNVVKILLRHGANLEARTRLGGETPLMAAAGNGFADVVRFLVGNGARVSAKCFQLGETAFLKALSFDRYETARFLVTEAGADVNERDIYGHTALFWAAHEGLAERVEFLLANFSDFIDPSVENEDGETAMEIAIERGHEKIAKMLVEHDNEKRQFFNKNVNDSENAASLAA